MRVRITHYLVSLLLGLTSGYATGATCPGDPSRHALSVFSKLESAEDMEVLEMYYNREFSPLFRSQYTFGDFYQNIAQIQKRLGIGAVNGRAFARRALTHPQVVAESTFALGRPLMYPDSPTQASRTLDLEFYTTSAVGKIRQKIQLVCWEKEWKVQGIWYLPLG